MTKITFKLPETLEQQAEEIAEKRGYQNKSEYIRAAIRDKIEEDLVVVRMQEKDGFVGIGEAKEQFEGDSGE